MMTVFLLVTLVCLLLAATAQAGPAGVYSLRSGEITVGFDITGGNVSMTELSGTDGRNWIAKPAKGPLWRIAYTDSKGNAKEIDSLQAEAIHAAVHSANSLQFAWEVDLGEHDSEVEITIQARKGSPISLWSLKADLPEGWKVTRADFPILPYISLDCAKKMAVPFGWGLEYDVKPGMSYEATYP